MLLWVSKWIEEMKIPTGSKAELITEMLGTVKMNLILNHESTTFYNEGDTLPGTANTGLLGAAEKICFPKWNKCFLNWIPFWVH